MIKLITSKGTNGHDGMHSERHNIASVIVLPKTQSLNLIMGKDETNPNRGASYKI